MGGFQASILSLSISRALDARELFGKRDDGIDHWPDRSPLGRRRRGSGAGPPQAPSLFPLNTDRDAGPPQEPNNDPNFGGEDCTIKWNDGTTWNDVPCDFTYPCYCQDVKGGGY